MVTKYENKILQSTRKVNSKETVEKKEGNFKAYVLYALEIGIQKWIGHLEINNLTASVAFLQ